MLHGNRSLQLAGVFQGSWQASARSSNDTLFYLFWQE
jgi:hypothetical protein